MKYRHCLLHHLVLRQTKEWNSRGLGKPRAKSAEICVACAAEFRRVNGETIRQSVRLEHTFKGQTLVRGYQ